MLRPTLLRVLSLALLAHATAVPPNLGGDEIPRPFSALEGNWTTAVVPLSWPSATVLTMAQDYLGPNVRLAPQNQTAAGFHPLILFVGNQTHLHTEPVEWLKIRQYYETILVITSLRWADDSESTPPFGTSVVLYLDESLAIIGGNFFYGFPKKPSRILVSGSLASGSFSFVAEHPLKKAEALLSVNVTASTSPQSGAWQPSNSLGPDFQAYLAYLDAAMNRIVQRDEEDLTGKRVFCSAMDVHLSTASFFPCDVHANLAQGFAAGSPAGQWKVAPVAVGTHDGAFMMQTWWRLSKPWVKC